jgi:anti-sigma regulatory factor (Ser/Thr protein kinase)
MEPLIVPGVLDSLGAIGRYVMEAATAAGIDKATAYRLRLAVDEVATNIMVHGYDEAGRRGDVEVGVVIGAGTLSVYLEDTGIPYDPTRRPLPDDLHLPLEEREMGGLGVFLAIEGVDDFRYEWANERNRNIFTVNRPAA